jgi:hypothetical protein
MANEVDSWFADFEHPLKDVMLDVRRVILGADERITESIKWKTPTFSYKGNLVSFQSNAKKFVSLMFHTGAQIPGEHPHLEGDAAQVRTMKIANLDELAQKRAALEAVVQAWCEWRASEK